MLKDVFLQFLFSLSVRVNRVLKAIGILETYESFGSIENTVFDFDIEIFDKR